MSDVVTRAATESDWSEIEALLTENALPVAGAHEHVRTFWIATDDNRIIGIVGMEAYGTAALLRSVAVRPMRQGHGIGRTLLNVAMTAAAGTGVETLYLLTTTAARYFEKHGFEVVDRGSMPYEVTSSVEFRDACPASATCMRRDIA